ncbi:MAG: YHYH protein [Cyanobacteria bacterium P01_F01_bin.116]
MKTIKLSWRHLAVSLLLLGYIADSTSAHNISHSHKHSSHQRVIPELSTNTIPKFTHALLHKMVLGNSQLIGQNSQLTNQVIFDDRNGYRYIYTNGIPDHTPGTFPNPGNPNNITTQNHIFRVTLTPQLSGRSTPVRPVFGVALNGIPFEPVTAEYWNRDRNSGWNYDALSDKINLGLDQHNAHVQPNGSYHYHGLPTGLLQGTAMTLVGYAADGFPVYGQYGHAVPNSSTSGLVELQSSYRLKTGQRPSGPGGTYDGTFVQDYEYVVGLGDLDDCNGRFGITPEHPEGIYHYHITATFPFIPRCVKGIPDESFQRQPADPGNPRNSRTEGRPNGHPANRPPFPLPGPRPF